jgi:hypothetical protein
MLKIGGEKMEQPIIRLQKNAETTTNKIRIPQQIIDKWGNKFYMEMYKDCIKLIPIKKGE